MHCRIALCGVALAAAPLGAQTDFRNLDRGRPLQVEDAYPIERYAFEVTAAHRFAFGERGGLRNELEAGVGYGVARGTSVAVSVPLLLRWSARGAPAGLAGLGTSILANLTTERPGVPALALRGNATLPVGAAGPSDLTAGVQLLGTMSIGRSRVNLSGGVGLGRPNRPAALEPDGLWRLGVQVDRTLLRSSTLVAVEIVTTRAERGDPVEVQPALGLRRQVAPTLVLDLGVGAALAAGRRTRTSLTLGFSHLFAVAALMPGGPR